MPARRSIDDPRVLQSVPFRAVHFVFGLVGLYPLPGTALVASLTSLGMSAGTARAVLLRYRRAGALTSVRRGRAASYELTPGSRALVTAVAARVNEPPPVWDGAFRTALVSVPEHARAYRERLRRTAAYVGFGTLRPGVLIAPYDTAWRGLDAALQRAPAGTRVLRGELRLSAADARAVAADVWDLERLSAELRGYGDRMRHAAEVERARQSQGAEALVALWDAIGPFFALVSGRPPLPTDLLPEPWPLAETRDALNDVSTLLAPRAAAFVLSTT